MDAIKKVLGALLAFVKEVWVAIGFEEGVAALEDLDAKFGE